VSFSITGFTFSRNSRILLLQTQYW